MGRTYKCNPSPHLFYRKIERDSPGIEDRHYMKLTLDTFSLSRKSCSMCYFGDEDWIKYHVINVVPFNDPGD